VNNEIIPFQQLQFYLELQDRDDICNNNFSLCLLYPLIVLRKRRCAFGERGKPSTGLFCPGFSKPEKQR